MGVSQEDLDREAADEAAQEASDQDYGPGGMDSEADEDDDDEEDEGEGGGEEGATLGKRKRGEGKHPHTTKVLNANIPGMLHSRTDIGLIAFAGRRYATSDAGVSRQRERSRGLLSLLIGFRAAQARKTHQHLRHQSP